MPATPVIPVRRGADKTERAATTATVTINELGVRKALATNLGNNEHFGISAFLPPVRRCGAGQFKDGFHRDQQRCAQEACLASQLARHNLHLVGIDGVDVTSHSFNDGAKEQLACLGDASSENDVGNVEEIDHVGDAEAEVDAGLPKDFPAKLIALAGVLHDRFALSSLRASDGSSLSELGAPASSRAMVLATMPRPATTASRQPRLPQRQRGPPGKTTVWPISPAPCHGPR